MVAREDTLDLFVDLAEGVDMAEGVDLAEGVEAGQVDMAERVDLAEQVAFVDLAKGVAGVNKNNCSSGCNHVIK